MVLADVDIEKRIGEGEIGVKPFEASQLLPDGYALRLSSKFRFIRIGDKTHVDVKEKMVMTEEVDVGDDGYVNIRPGELVLGSSLESISLGKCTAAMLQGRTSLSRLGLQLDTSAAKISPGYNGRITLTFVNVFALPIRIYVGMRVAELTFVAMSRPVKTAYGKGAYSSRYQKQTGPTESRIWEDFGEDR